MSEDPNAGGDGKGKDAAQAAADPTAADPGPAADNQPDPAPAPAAAAPVRPELVPEKFWDPDKGEVRLDELAKSYSELERARLERTGKAPAEYKLPKAFEGFEHQIPADQLKGLMAAAKEDGFSQAGFEGLAKAWFGDPGAVQAELKEAFGADLEPTLEAVRMFANTLGEHEEAVRVMCGFAGGIKLLDAWRKASAGLGLPGQPGEASGGQKTHAELREMMKDERYWRDHDPAYMAEVEKGFQALYPDRQQTAPINPTGAAA